MEPAGWVQALRDRNINVCDDIDGGQTNASKLFGNGIRDCLSTGDCCHGRRLDSKSPMSGDVHVRFCEHLGVRFPRMTRPTLCFEYEDDARKVMAVLPKRFNRFGLELNEAKTKRVTFQRPRGASRATQHNAPKSTFDFLSFTHFWARPRKGYWVIKARPRKSDSAAHCNRYPRGAVGIIIALSPNSIYS